MPPRSELRRGPPRLSRSPSGYGTTPINDPTLWPDEGSDLDPEYTPSDTETESETDEECDYSSESDNDSDSD
jgi:hypothetical protein